MRIGNNICGAPGTKTQKMLLLISPPWTRIMWPARKSEFLEHVSASSIHSFNSYCGGASPVVKAQGARVQSLVGKWRSHGPCDLSGKEIQEKRRHKDTYSWFTLPYSRNQCNIVKQIYSNLKNKDITLIVTHTQTITIGNGSHSMSILKMENIWMDRIWNMGERRLSELIKSTQS